LGPEARLLTLGRLLVTLGLTNGEEIGAMKRADLESVMADTGEKVGTKAGKVNIPDHIPEATNETLASPEQQLIWRSLLAQGHQPCQEQRNLKARGRSLELKR